MDGSSNAGCDSDEEVDWPPNYSKCMYEWVVYSALFVVGGVRKFVVALRMDILKTCVTVILEYVFKT